MSTRVTLRPFSGSEPTIETFGLSDQRTLPTPVLAFLTGFSYYIGSQIGFFLTPAGSPIAVFWPPNAILLAIFLLTPRRTWWALVAAVCPVHFLIQLSTGIPALSALGWFIGNVGEALLGAICVLYFQKEKALWFTTVKGVVRFLVFGALFAPLVTSFLDAGSTVLTGLSGDYWTLWMSRLTSNMIANLTVTPCIVTFAVSGIPWFRKASRAQYFEAVLLTVATAVACFLVFARGDLFDRGPAFICAPLPFLIWAALRFGPAGLNVTMLEVTLIAVWSALQGRGIFAYSSMPDRVISVHILVGLYILPLLLMAAVIAERRLKEDALENTREKLIDAQEQECHRIARELHTDIAGRLTLAGFSVDELQADYNASEKQTWSRLYDQVSDAFKATLRLSHKVYPFRVEYLGLASALIKLCRDTGAEVGISIKSAIENVPLDIPLEASLRIFRVAQLALQDIQERQANTASVELKVNDDRILLRTSDDGVGANPQRHEVMGIAYMQEQLLSLGGTFKQTSASGGGMVIEASIPNRKTFFARKT